MDQEQTPEQILRNLANDAQKIEPTQQQVDTVFAQAFNQKSSWRANHRRTLSLAVTVCLLLFATVTITQLTGNKSDSTSYAAVIRKGKAVANFSGVTYMRFRIIGPADRDTRVELWSIREGYSRAIQYSKDGRFESKTLTTPTRLSIFPANRPAKIFRSVQNKNEIDPFIDPLGSFRSKLGTKNVTRIQRKTAFPNEKDPLYLLKDSDGIEIVFNGATGKPLEYRIYSGRKLNVAWRVEKFTQMPKSAQALAKTR